MGCCKWPGNTDHLINKIGSDVIDLDLGRLEKDSDLRNQFQVGVKHQVSDIYNLQIRMPFEVDPISGTKPRSFESKSDYWSNFILECCRQDSDPGSGLQWEFNPPTHTSWLRCAFRGPVLDLITIQYLNHVFHSTYWSISLINLETIKTYTLWMR